MKDNKLITFAVIFLIAVAISFGIGYFMGQSTIDTKTETTYTKGETVSGSVSNIQIEPVKENKPEKPLLPMKEISIQYRDTGSLKTMTKYIYQVVDTAAIIEDYILKRSYRLTAFDNTEQGKLLLFPEVQYNKLIGVDYEFTPMQKQTSSYKEKIWQPFVSGSYSTLNYIGVGGGVFYHNLGFEYQYQIGCNTNIGNGHLIGAKYKF